MKVFGVCAGSGGRVKEVLAEQNQDALSVGEVALLLHLAGTNPHHTPSQDLQVCVSG